MLPTVFTRGAKETAAIWDLELKDHDDILAWCSQPANTGAPEGRIT
jgi:hypothetical protein